jgi:hypothetical protein
MSSPFGKSEYDPYGLLWPITDTKSRFGLWRLDTPHCSTKIYEVDRATFRKLGANRSAFIRVSVDEFGATFFPSEREYSPLWVLVLRIVTGWHVILPIWRGPALFDHPAESDAEVADQVATYCANSGHDYRDFRMWKYVCDLMEAKQK